MNTYKRQRRAYSRVIAKVAVAPQKALAINIILILAVFVAFVAHALLINHLNTVSFKLNDIAREESRLVERNSELEGRIAELQTLGSIEERAVELGMVAVGEYTFLSSAPTVVAQR